MFFDMVYAPIFDASLAVNLPRFTNRTFQCLIIRKSSWIIHPKLIGRIIKENFQIVPSIFPSVLVSLHSQNLPNQGGLLNIDMSSYMR